MAKINGWPSNFSTENRQTTPVCLFHSSTHITKHWVDYSEQISVHIINVTNATKNFFSGK